MLGADVKAADVPSERQVWRRGAAWLVLLGPFFFASYGFANWLASRRGGVGSVVFAWEHRIPFVPWTIVPYWSIDLLYGLSLLVCTTRREVDRHAQRLLAIQVIAAAFFIAIPLRFTFDRPEAGGVYGALFAALGAFDKPYNQAPSLHIALLVAIWTVLLRHSGRVLRVIVNVWMVLIAVSVLTTYQHHFIDLPTGLLLGFVVLWALPEGAPSPLRCVAWSGDPRRHRVAAMYLGAVAVLAAASFSGGARLWLLWPAVSSALVAVNYLLLGVAGFQKGSDGRFSAAARALLLPYLAAAFVNSRLWTWRHPEASHVVDGVWIGRFPASRDLRGGQFQGAVDMTAELSCRIPDGVAYVSVPILDLTVPDVASLRRAADAIEEQRQRGAVLVCCALGYSRSAAAVVAWLLRTRRADSFAAAVGMVVAVRPFINLHAGHAAVMEVA